MPKTPEEYELKLPESFQPPVGVDYKLDMANPALGELRAVAHKWGLPNEAVSDLLGIYAGNEVSDRVSMNAVAKAQREELGSAAPQRVDTVTRWIAAEAGNDANPIILSMGTAAHVRFYEKLMQKFATQGAAAFTQSHRSAPEANGIPGFEKMSFEQRRQAQDQNAARRRA